MCLERLNIEKVEADADHKPAHKWGRMYGIIWFALLQIGMEVVGFYSFIPCKLKFFFMLAQTEILTTNTNTTISTLVYLCTVYVCRNDVRIVALLTQFNVYFSLQFSATHSKFLF